jgi:hypothetical protein
MDNLTQQHSERPVRILIGGILYRIEYVYDLHDREGNLAQAALRWGEAIIEVESRLDPQEQRVSIWHEAIHLILRQAGYVNGEVPEDAIDSLGYGITSALRQNAFLRQIP